MGEERAEVKGVGGGRWAGGGPTFKTTDIPVKQGAMQTLGKVWFDLCLILL